LILSEKKSPILFIWVSHIAKKKKQLRTILLKPNQFCKQSSKIVGSIVSNAADKSSMTNAVGQLLARDASMSLFIFTKAVSVECPDLYADWIV
jgi:hypothetical protein